MKTNINHYTFMQLFSPFFSKKQILFPLPFLLSFCLYFLLLAVYFSKPASGLKISTRNKTSFILLLFSYPSYLRIVCSSTTRAWLLLQHYFVNQTKTIYYYYFPTQLVPFTIYFMPTITKTQQCYFLPLFPPYFFSSSGNIIVWNVPCHNVTLIRHIFPTAFPIFSATSHSS